MRPTPTDQYRQTWETPLAPPLSDYEIQNRFERLERNALWTTNTLKGHDKDLKALDRRIAALEWLRNAGKVTVVFVWDNWLKIGSAAALISALMTGKISEVAKILAGG